MSNGGESFQAMVARVNARRAARTPLGEGKPMGQRKESGPKYTVKDSKTPMQETRFVVPDKGSLRRRPGGKSFSKGGR